MFVFLCVCESVCECVSVFCLCVCVSLSFCLCASTLVKMLESSGNYVRVPISDPLPPPTPARPPYLPTLYPLVRLLFIFLFFLALAGTTNVIRTRGCLSFAAETTQHHAPFSSCTASAQGTPSGSSLATTQLLPLSKRLRWSPRLRPSNPGV